MFKRNTLVLMAITLLLASCTKNQIKESVEGVGTATYLYFEYTQFRDSVAALEFSDSDRAILKDVDESINAVRLEVGSIYKARGYKAVVSLLKARSMVGQLQEGFKKADPIILNYYDSRDLPIPPNLKFFRQQAVLLNNTIQEVLENSTDETTSLETVGFYMQTLLRMYVSAKTGGLL